MEITAKGAVPEDQLCSAEAFKSERESLLAAVSMDWRALKGATEELKGDISRVPRVCSLPSIHIEGRGGE